MSDVAADSAETVRLLEQVGQGDSQGLDALLARYRPRLHAFVRVRLDPRVRSRLDASDVVQEAQLRIAERVGEFLERRPSVAGGLCWLADFARVKSVTATGRPTRGGHLEPIPKWG